MTSAISVPAAAALTETHYASENKYVPAPPCRCWPPCPGTAEFPATPELHIGLPVIYAPGDEAAIPYIWQPVILPHYAAT